MTHLGLRRRARSVLSRIALRALGWTPLGPEQAEDESSNEDENPAEDLGERQARALDALEIDEAAIKRWNREWLRYLGREWPVQLKPHHEYPETPPLPDDPAEVYGLRLGASTPPLSLYCRGEDLRGLTVMELGCGCGNLGKLLGRYAQSYVGADHSPLALQVARLVSPANCRYIHVADRGAVEHLAGTIDTVVSRFFWIHQNHVLGRANLRYLARFLKPGRPLYLDFYWPDPDAPQGLVLRPSDHLSAAHPSAVFRYDEADVRDLLDGLPFTIEEMTISLEHQRRYVRARREPSAGSSRDQTTPDP